MELAVAPMAYCDTERVNARCKSLRRLRKKNGAARIIIHEENPIRSCPRLSSAIMKHVQEKSARNAAAADRQRNHAGTHPRLSPNKKIIAEPYAALQLHSQVEQRKEKSGGMCAKWCTARSDQVRHPMRSATIDSKDDQAAVRQCRKKKKRCSRFLPFLRLRAEAAHGGDTQNMGSMSADPRNTRCTLSLAPVFARFVSEDSCEKAARRF